MQDFDSIGEYYAQSWRDYLNGNLPVDEPRLPQRPQTPVLPNGLRFDCIPVENVWLPEGATYDRGLISKLANDMEHCGGLPFVVPVFPASGETGIYIASPHPTAIAAIVLMQRLKMAGATFQICPDLPTCQAVSAYLPDFNQVLHDLLPQLFEAIQAGRMYASEAESICNAISSGEFRPIFEHARFWAGQLDGYDRLIKLQSFCLLVANGEEELTEIASYLELL